MNPIMSYLRREREKQGMSAAKVARRIGCSDSSIWNWETGTKCPSLDNACAYARALGMDIVVLNDLKIIQEGGE